jgi:hypothetical protein
MELLLVISIELAVTQMMAPITTTVKSVEPCSWRCFMDEICMTGWSLIVVSHLNGEVAK